MNKPLDLMWNPYIAANAEGFFFPPNLHLFAFLQVLSMAADSNMTNVPYVSKFDVHTPKHSNVYICNICESLDPEFHIAN
jgi:hypothetical protein